MNLPIAERELRVAARTPRTYRLRMLGGLIFGVATGWLLWSSRYGWMQPQYVAPQVFAIVAFMATLTAMFNINATADSISSEKRSGTLGLLFLTDLKARDIVFGKLAAVGVATFYGMMAMIPMISMPVLLGGIKGEHQIKTALALMNTLFFALSAGLWVSAKSYQQKRAMNSCVWIALLFLWGIPGLAAFFQIKLRMPQVAEALLVLSPIYQQQHASPFGAGMLKDHYWLSLGVTHGLAWLALWRACRIVPHEWQDRPAKPVQGKWRERWNRFRYGASETRERFRRRLLERNAIHWLSSMDLRGPLWIWMFVALVMVGWVVMWAWFRFALKEDVPAWGVGIPATIILQMGLWIRTSAIAADVLARDRFSGALELVLSTSLTIEEIVRGQAMTVRRNVLWPSIFTLAIGIAVFWLGYAETKNGDDRLNCWAAFIGMTVLFVTQAFSAFWCGLWASCTTRLPNGSAAVVMMRLLVAPWVVFFVGMTIFAVLRIRTAPDDFYPVFMLWFAMNFANAVAWGIWSREKFHANVRTVAAERYQAPRKEESWWKFWTWRQSETVV